MRLSGRVSRGIRALVITRWIYRVTVCVRIEKKKSPLGDQEEDRQGWGEGESYANLVRSRLIAVPIIGISE